MIGLCMINNVNDIYIYIYIYIYNAQFVQMKIHKFLCFLVFDKLEK